MLQAHPEGRALQPLQRHLARYRKGRRYYNDRVVPTESRGKRSYPTDDEEFYRAYLLNISGVEDFLTYSERWLYFHNALRPHFGASMNGWTPLAALQSLGLYYRSSYRWLPAGAVGQTGHRSTNGF